MITPEQKTKLVEEAKKALKNVFPKGWPSAYSAAVLTKKGNIYSAASYVSDTFSLTLHGEQSVLVHAAAHGEYEILAIAIASTEELKKGEFTPPCHMCKQVLYESSLHSGLPMLVILANNHGETKEIDLKDMLPFPWPKN
jgi:cytidine deaminase